MKSGIFILLLIGIISIARSEEEKCRCGWKNPSRIVNGVETGINEFPMMARILYPLPYNYCGGSIITPRHILTAAHCVELFINNLNSLTVVVGEHDYTKDNETNAMKRYSVEEVTIHPDYWQHFNDIAIVKTKERIDYSMQVGPVCLPFNYMDKDFVNETVTASGWGKLSYHGENSKVLRKVDLHVITPKKCSDSYRFFYSPKMICTFDVGKDACKNDSGGPVLWTSPTTGNLIQVGVISFGRTCADDYPGGNMRVTSYMDFIEKATTGETYCKAD
ncbi:PREDICTED: venom serine protease-like [Polistes canadensis]|uniref:venom serine protease-like n=1 Tax=Polistes canadensis TaxID=91411 RepID=UPI000718E273|nr:PREDICTED: venom serine protease-like [Polistes canadensis]